jgi:two-component system, LytTR family, response regulator
MNKLSCIIIDDEQACVSILEKMLEKYFKEDIEIIGAYTNPIEALKNINLLKPNILFCDVEMPRLSGIDLVNTLDKNQAEVIFTTAHSKYAIDAFKLDAVDYLVKPFGKDDLIEAVERCKKRIQPQQEIPATNIAATPQSIKVSIHLSNGSIQFIDSADIIYIESQSNYSHFVIKDKPKLIVSKTLKEFDELLTPYGFFRTHHSYLVNLSFIDSYKGGTEDALLLTNGDIVYLSRRRKQDFLERMSK